MPNKQLPEGAVPNKQPPIRTWESPQTLRPPQLENKLRSVAGRGDGPSAADGPASPAEGAELIRAFLNIEQRDVRAAIIKLVTSLSTLGSHDD